MEAQADTGIFIVIEGVDGSGKSTQFARLHERLVRAGYDVLLFKFPQYDQPSSYFVREYLAGHYGEVNAVGPYTSSLFYALDRYEAAPQIREALAQGKIVLADRYVGSNMAHQGTKFQHAEERRGYFIWLDNLEFELLQIPRPDANIVLRVPAEVADELIERHTVNGGLKRDLHENDRDHLQKTVQVYDDMCQLFPRDFQRIDCTRDNELLDIDTVHDIIWQKVEPLLPAQKPNIQESATTAPPLVQEEPNTPHSGTSSQVTDDYYVPDTLSGDIRDLYLDIINRILALRGEVAALLVDHTDARRELALRAIIPVAASGVAPLEPAQNAKLGHIINRLTKGLLPTHYADSTAALRLINVWPRNELDLVADIIYAATDLPFTVLQEASARWPYELKLKLFEAYLTVHRDTTGNALQKARYSWDMLQDYATILDLQAAMPGQHLEHQALTPRYGYAVPSIIEELDVVEQFETCFDLSLQLYSSLQQAGFVHEAQYATLLGHKVRSTLTYGATEALQLFRQSPTLHANVRAVMRAMHEQLSAVHPIIGESVTIDEKVQSNV